MKAIFIAGICILVTVSLFSGCVNVPKELTQFSIVSFDVDPSIINPGESANLSWVVISATLVSIDNGFGTVPLTGHRMITPTGSTTYILTATNATSSKSVSVQIIIRTEIPQTSNITFMKDETADRLVVVSVNSDANWQRFGLKADKSGIVFRLNGDVDSSHETSLPNGITTHITTTSSTILAGDYIDFEGDSSAISTVKISVIDMEANQILAEFTFAEIQALQSHVPNITFTKDETTDRLVVVSADSDANWQRMGLKMDEDSTVFRLNGDVDSSHEIPLPIGVTTRITIASSPVYAGDFIDFEGDPAAISNIKVTVIDIDGNQILAEFTFALIQEIS